MYKGLLQRSESLSDNRVEYIDLAKGVAIFLIVALHCNLGTTLTEYVAMPTFFTIAGLFFSNKGLKKLVYSKFNRLIVPMLLFDFIAMVYYYFEYKYLSTLTPDFNLLKWVTLSKLYNAPLWFLQALLLDAVIFFILTCITKNKLLIGVAVLAFATVSALQVEAVPFVIRRAFMSTPFFFMGYCLKGSWLQRPARKFDIRLVGIAVLVLVCCFLFSRYVYYSGIAFVGALIVGHPLVLYAESMLCVIATLVICRNIGWLPVLSYLGRFSLTVVGIHILFTNFFFHIFLKLPMNKTLMNVIVLIITVGLSIVAIAFFRKYMPHLSGEADFIAYAKEKWTKLRLRLPAGR